MRNHEVYVGIPWANNGVEEVGVIRGQDFYWTGQGGEAFSNPTGVVKQLRKVSLLDDLTLGTLEAKLG